MQVTGSFATHKLTPHVGTHSGQDRERCSHGSFVSKPFHGRAAGCGGAVCAWGCSGPSDRPLDCEIPQHVRGVSQAQLSDLGTTARHRQPGWPATAFLANHAQQGPCPGVGSIFGYADTEDTGGVCIFNTTAARCGSGEVYRVAVSNSAGATQSRASLPVVDESCGS